MFAIAAGLGVCTQARESLADEVARPAPQETWLRDARFQSGVGIQTEQYRISPWVAAAVEYDSNVFLRSGNKAIPTETPVVDAIRLTVTPAVSIQPRGNLRGRSYAFSGFASATYYQFLNGFSNRRGPGDDVTGQSDFGAVVAGKLQFAPGARISGDVHGGLVRTIQPSNSGDPTQAFNRTMPSVGATVGWSPGGGLFAWNWAYDLALTFFDEVQFRRNDNAAHTFSTSTSWRFLPRTSVFSDARYTMFRYRDRRATTQSDGDSVQARAGLNGLVTNGFGFLIAGGWASTFFDPKGVSDADFDSFIAQVEGRFYLAAPPREKEGPGSYASTLNVGYLRDWQQSYIGNFFQRDRGYAQLGYFVGGRWFATTGAAVSRLAFPETVFPDGTLRNVGYVNVAVEANATVEFRPTPHVGLSSQLAYTQMLSDTKLRTASGPAATALDVDDQRWSRFTAMLGGRYLF